VTSEARVRDYLAGDAERLAAVMRPADAAEVQAETGHAPLEALLESVRVSRKTWALELGGELAGIFGLRDGPRQSFLAQPDYMVPWLLTGAAVDRHRRAFWATSRRVMGAFLEMYPVLANLVDARYAAALRWAWRLGGEIHDAVPIGPSGALFHPVIWRRHG